MFQRLTPLWLALVLPYALVIALVCGVLMLSQQRTVSQLIDEESANLLNISSEHVQTRLQHYLDVPFHLQAVLSDTLVQQSLYTPGDLSQVERYVTSVFTDLYQQQFKHLSMVQFGTDNGDFFGIGSQHDTSIHITLKDRRTDHKLVEFLADRRTPKITLTDYDPRKRPWYTPVASSLKPRWSPLYRSSTDSDFFIMSATAPVLSEKGELLGVISTDVSLYALSEFLRQTPLHTSHKSAVLYIVDEQGKLIAQSQGGDIVKTGSKGQPQTISTAAESSSELVRFSFARLPDSREPFVKPSTLQLHINDTLYFGRVTPFNDKRGLNWRIVTLVAAQDLTGNAYANATNSLYAVLVLTLLGLAFGMWVVKRITRPIQETAAAAELLANAWDTDFAPMRSSHILETSMLTSAFNTMSLRIKTQLSTLHDLAMNDSATQLLNRQGLLAAAQWTTPKDIMLILLGVDNLKAVNTSLGTATGDHLLRAFAKRLRAACPDSCLIARVSGGEFMVLLPHVMLPSQCTALLEAVQGVFIKPFETLTDEVILEASFGIVTTCATGADVEKDLLQQASIALHVARSRGQRQVVYFKPALMSQTVADAQMLVDLKQALITNELRVYFQPIVDLATEKVAGMEALVRWQSVKRGMVGPVEFIPIAEESGLIVELGNWVLIQATHEIAQLMQKNELPQNFALHVNVSVRQLVQTDFAAKVAHSLAQSGLPASMLMVEITESLLMDNETSTLNTIAAIRALGVGIALDDFGTGYSSLSYLNRFHFHAIKIDRSFVVAAEKSASSLSILKAVVDITHGLGVEAVAEGIETREQARMLRDFGCTFAQGYLFGKPAPLQVAWAALNTTADPQQQPQPIQIAPPMIPLSVLDLSPILQGSTAAQSFRNSLSLAQHAEQWGFSRYWLAEHHGMPGIASAATAVLMAHIAAGTRSIRVGAGGIMLPNHSPLVIAEQFGTLASLHPGRIDLGLGRAPGSDQITARALRRNLDADADGFPQDVLELQDYFSDQPRQPVRAVPGTGLNVPLWILGSSLYGAQLAAALGLPYAFASHFAPQQMMEAIALYRALFKPSAQCAKPYVMLGFNLFAADTDAEATYRATSWQHAFVNLRSGRPGQLPPPIEGYFEGCGPQERTLLESVLSCAAVGSKATIRAQINAFIARTGADELMLTCGMFDHAARLHSYEIASEIAAEIAAESATEGSAATA